MLEFFADANRITAIATGITAGVAVVTLIVKGVYKSIESRKKRSWERDPLSRVEIVNALYHKRERNQGATHVEITIRVRNLSHLPVTFDAPVFEIRKKRSLGRRGGLMIQQEKTTRLDPEESTDLHRAFEWSDFQADFEGEVQAEWDWDRFTTWLAEVARQECTIVDLGWHGA